MKVGVDLDGVAYEFHRVFMDAARQMQRAPGAWKRLKRANLDHAPPGHWFFYRDHGLHDADFKAIVHESVDKGVMYARGPAIRGTAAGWRKLLKDGHEVHVITDRDQGRPGQARKNTLRWLENMGLHFHSIHFTPHKAEVGLELGLDAHIDDKPENVTSMTLAGIPRVHMMTQGWNEHLPWDLRVTSLLDFAERLEHDRG